jgi:MFS family permease
VRLHTFDSFRYRDYRSLWGATFFSSGGSWLQEITIGWLTYELTKSAFLTSLALGLTALPILLAGPLGGVLVDSLDRRKVLAIVSAYQILVTLGFSAIVFLDRAEPWNIMGFVLLMGIAWVFADPSRTSLIPNLVPRQNLINAFALNSLAFSGPRLLAPLLGGAILALAGPGPALLSQATVYLVAMLLFLSLRVASSHRAKLRLGSTFKGLVDGARYVKGEPMILGLMVIGGIPSILVLPFVHGLMPVYAAEVFDVGAPGLGLLLAAIGAGSAIGSIGLASLGDIHRTGRIIIGSLVLVAVAMALFSQVRSYGLAVPTLMMLSVGVGGFWATTVATIQSMASDEFRGRVAGLYMLTWGVFPVGSLIAGGLADRLGPELATLMAVGGLGVVLVVVALRFRRIWWFERP